MAEGELALPREIATRRLPSAAAAHLDNGEAYTRWHIRGHLQWMNEDVRSVQQGGDAAPVVSFALTDDTGPILVDFWREAATQYLDLLRGALEDESNPVLVLKNVFQIHADAQPRSHEAPLLDRGDLAPGPVCGDDASHRRESFCAPAAGPVRDGLE